MPRSATSSMPSMRMRYRSRSSRLASQTRKASSRRTGERGRLAKSTSPIATAIAPVAAKHVVGSSDAISHASTSPETIMPAKVAKLAAASTAPFRSGAACTWMNASLGTSTSPPSAPAMPSSANSSGTCRPSGVSGTSPISTIAPAMPQTAGTRTRCQRLPRASKALSSPPSARPSISTNIRLLTCDFAIPY